MAYSLNRLDEPICTAVSKPLLTELGIHHRLEICGLHNSDCKTQLVIFFFGLFAGDLLRQLSPPKPAPTPALSRSPTQNQRQHRRKNIARRFSRVSQQIDALRAHHLPEKYMSPFLFILPPQRDPVSSSGRHLPILSRTKDHWRSLLSKRRLIRQVWDCVQVPRQDYWEAPHCQAWIGSDKRCEEFCQVVQKKFQRLLSRLWYGVIDRETTHRFWSSRSNTDTRGQW